MDAAPFFQKSQSAVWIQLIGFENLLSLLQKSAGKAFFENSILGPMDI
jgi:hypothetical protein